MSYRNRTIKVLSKKEIEERYPKENNSNVTKLTREFVERGFKIVRLKMDGLSSEKFLTMEVNDAVEIVLNNDNFEIGCYTDLSEKLQNDTIYVAVKVLGRPRHYYHWLFNDE